MQNAHTAYIALFVASKAIAQPFLKASSSSIYENVYANFWNLNASGSFIANIRVITSPSLTWIDRVINNSYGNIYFYI